MTRLGLTLPASPYETPTDYLSRLSARNLAPGMWSFSGDCGLDFAALSAGDPDAVAHLCAIASLPPDSFAGRTVIKTSSMRYLLGSEVLNTETLSRGEIRFCPICVREALESGARPWDVIHELHWQFIQIRRCCRHGTALQSRRFALDRTSRFDFTTLTRVTRDYITFESLARFEAEYITIGQLARGLSTSSQKLRRDTRLIGAAPLTRTKGVRTMFRRKDLTTGVHVQSDPEIG